MKQSTFKSPRHVAIIMDGNGRWAQQRNKIRTEGHRAGATAVRRTVRAAAERNVEILTLYAFSSDNWRRPPSEISALMLLFRHYLLHEVTKCVNEGVRVSVIGRRDRLPRDLVELIERTEAATAGGKRLHLRLAIDYSSRDQILAAAAIGASRETFDTYFGPDVDLLIRTAGEQRLSDFLLWECAYAELVFVKEQWPDFDARSLDRAIVEYANRERRFGGLQAVAKAPVAALG